MPLQHFENNNCGFIQRHFKKDSAGFITLIGVLFIGFIGTTVALALFYSSISSSKSALLLDRTNRAKAFANACTEHALQKIRDDSLYSGSESISFGNAGSCDILNVDFDSLTFIYTINAQSTVDSIIRKVKVTATRADLEPNAITIQTWQEVADF